MTKLMNTVGVGMMIGLAGALAGCVSEEGAVVEALADEAVIQESSQALGTATVGSAVSVVAFGTSRLDVFFNASGQLTSRTWTSSSGWGTDVTHTNSAHTMMGQPACISASAGTIDCLVQNEDNYVRRISYNGSSWGAWTDTSVFSASPPGAASSTSGQLDLFVSSGLYFQHRIWNGSTWVNAGQTAFAFSGGAPTNCGSRGDGTWGCALAKTSLVIPGGKAAYYVTGDSSTLSYATFTGGSGDPSAYLRGDMMEMVYRSSAQEFTYKDYSAGSSTPQTGLVGMGYIADAPRCAPWGTNQMICFSRDASDALLYSFYTYTTGTAGGSWAAWLYQ